MPEFLPITAVSSSGWRLLDALFQIPHFMQSDGTEVVLRGDVEALAAAARQVEPHYGGTLTLFPTDPTGLRVGVARLIRADAVVPELGPALSNLLASELWAEPWRSSEPMAWVAGWTIEGGAPTLRAYAARQHERSMTAAAQLSSSADFTRSASYMGSKRNLAAFLVEVVAAHIEGPPLVVDLMCGSGAASAAFSRHWPTIASDAQDFSRALARVQGGGFSTAAAEKMLEQMSDRFFHNLGSLEDRLGPLLETERELLFGSGDETHLVAFREFLRSTSWWKADRRQGGWSPGDEVEARQRDHMLAPYCLFSAYFANLFVGIRQAAEIDSLRFAIAGLEGEDQAWALGALVAAVSSVATSYARHFAQPKVKDPSDLRGEAFRQILTKRPMSVRHEFEVRLLSLAAQSERTPHPVETVPGPWSAALDAVARRIKDHRPVVYLDAPYKREEYSRYYHVLETLVRYHYPSAEGFGRVPSKAADDRFASEFFTRSRVKMAEALAEVLARVLDFGWTAVWSYSDMGAVTIPEVLARLPVCSARSYVTPFVHQSQRGRKPKSVLEYAVVLAPRSGRRGGKDPSESIEAPSE